MWRMNRFCCCCTLRCGCAIIAFLSIVATAHTAFYIQGLYASEDQNDSTDSTVLTLKILNYSILILQIVCVVTLIYAVIQADGAGCLVWLIGQILIIGLGLAVTFLELSDDISTKDVIIKLLGINSDVYHTIGYTIRTVIMISFWLTVCSYYIELKEKYGRTANTSVTTSVLTTASRR